MRRLTRFAVLSLLAGTSCAAASYDSSKILNRHSVWIEQALTWKRADGATDTHETYSAASVLYFGPDGKFGVFQGVAIKQDRHLGLSEGDGERVYAGEWKVVSGKVAVNYRLVSWYKVLLPEGQKPPAVPGAVREGEIRLEKSDAHEWHLQFDGKKYEPAPGFEAADLRSHLEIHEKHPVGGEGFPQ